MVEFSLVLPEEVEATHVATPKRRFKPLNAAKLFEHPRIGTGWDSLDRVFGISKLNPKHIGICMPSVYLLAGPPGCGKTSLLIPIMAYLTQQGVHEFLFASSEQLDDEIRMNVAGLGLDDVLGEMNTLVTQDLNEVLELLLDTDVEVVFLDSINKLHDSRYDTKDLLTNKVVSMERIVADANGCEVVWGSRFDEKTQKTIETRERSAPIKGGRKRIYIVISHVNSDDKIFGRIEMLHDVSGIIMVDMVEGFPNHRMVSCPTKNRWGATKVPAFFTMGVRGMEECEDPTKDLEDLGGHVPLAVRIARRKEREGR